SITGWIRTMLLFSIGTRITTTNRSGVRYMTWTWSPLPEREDSLAKKSCKLQFRAPLVWRGRAPDYSKAGTLVGEGAGLCSARVNKGWVHYHGKESQRQAAGVLS